MIIKEVKAKSILSKSQVYTYSLNPYTGCQHACSYCYARYMKRFTGHKEPWGQFIDVKVNAPELLSKEIKKKKHRASRTHFSDKGIKTTMKEKDLIKILKSLQT